LISTLRSASYNLAWGSSVYANVKATNIMGSSAPQVGNGALLFTIPDAPIQLTNDPQITSKS